MSGYYRIEVRRCNTLSAEEEQAMFATYRRRRTKGRREAIVRQYLYWAAEVACRYCGPRMAREDAIGAANLGLMQAIEEFDPARGRRFVTHSYFHIRRAVLSALRDTYVVNPSSGINVERHRFNQKKLDRPAFVAAKRKVFDNAGTTVALGSCREAGIERAVNHPILEPAADQRENADRKSALEHLRERITLLPEPARSILRLRYFFADTPHFKVIGATLGITEDSARYIHNRALAKLRDGLRKEL